MAAATPPLSLGEILDRTVQLYRRNFLLFMGISLLPAAFNVLVAGSVSIFFTSRAAVFQTPAGAQALLGLIAVLALFFVAGVPLLIAIVSLALSALNHAAFLRNRGEASTIRSAYAYGLRHFWRYLGILGFQLLFAAILPGAVFAGVFFVGGMVIALLATTGAGKALAVLFGVLAVALIFVLVAVAAWIWLRYCLAFPVCVTEDGKPWACMQRSSQLSKGSRGRIFVMYLLVLVLTWVAYYALTLPVDILLKLTVYKSMGAVALLTKPPVALQVISLFINFLERAFVMPIYAIALLLFYNDQRTRQEGYDIELLMAQAGWTTLAQPPAGVVESAGAIAPLQAAMESVQETPRIELTSPGLPLSELPASHPDPERPDPERPGGNGA